MPAFSIHALRLGDGVLALSPLPGRSGEYAADLTRLLDWRPDMVISMTSQPEMAGVGAADLGRDLQRRGIHWRPLPTPDFGIPNADGQARWPAISHDARQSLAGGGRVLIHCMGGCGRSGMAALRLMIDAGMPPAKALADLRKTRPCAVETQAQMDWATIPTPSE